MPQNDPCYLVNGEEKIFLSDCDPELYAELEGLAVGEKTLLSSMEDTVERIS